MPPDRSEFLQLLKPYYPIALKYCRALARKGNADQAEDIFQASLLKAIENIDSLKDKEKFKYWLFAIITNVFRDSIRKKFWGKFITLEDEQDRTVIRNFYINDNNEDNSEILIKALSKISEKEKTAILLFEIGGFTISEITEIQNEKTESCIKQRLSRSRIKLQKIISKLESEKLEIQPGGNIKLPKDENSNQTVTEETIKIISELNTIKNE